MMGVRLGKQKKSYFLNGKAIMALPTPPLELNGRLNQGNKKNFFAASHSLTLPTSINNDRIEYV